MLDTTATTGAWHVLSWAKTRPQAVAVVEDGESITYAALAAQLANLVTALEAEGVRAGAIVGLECDGPYLRVLLALACEVLGAIHIAFKSSELHAADETARRCQMFLAQNASRAFAAANRVVRVDRALVAGLEAPATAEALSRLATSHPADAGVRIAKTSGATGAPKHMLKTRRILNAAIDSYDVALRPVAGDFTYVCHYSPAINGVYTDILRALRFGNKIAFVADIPAFIAACEADRCYALLLPREAERLAAECRRRSLNLDMHYVDVTGSAVSPELEAALRASVSSRVANVYSSNETSLIAYWETANRYAVVPGVEVRIVDDEWRPLAPGRTGRICVRSPLVVDGYLWDEALSARHFRDGWFLMSDLGSMPAPDTLRVLGRTDDMLDIGGVKVAPNPIEQALRSIAGVSGALVLRVDSAAAVGLMCAAIEPAPGQDEPALVRRVADVMARHAKAFVIHLEAAFPRTDTGKVRRDLLRTRIEAGRRASRGPAAACVDGLIGGGGEEGSAGRPTPPPPAASPPSRCSAAARRPSSAPRRRARG